MVVSLLHHVRLVLEHSGLVGVYVQVVGSREDRHDRWETGRLGFTVHSVSTVSPCLSLQKTRDLPSILSFMRSNDR
jgi:hypothetical protein